MFHFAFYLGEPVTGALRRPVPVGTDSASRMRVRNSATGRQLGLNRAVGVNLGFMRPGDGRPVNAQFPQMGNLGDAYATASSSGAATDGVSDAGIADVNPDGRIETLHGRGDGRAIDGRAPNGRADMRGAERQQQRGEGVEQQQVVAAPPEGGHERRYVRAAQPGDDIGQRQVGAPVAPGEGFEQRLVGAAPPGEDIGQRQVGAPVAPGGGFEQPLVGAAPPGAEIEVERRQMGADAPPGESFEQRYVNAAPPGAGKRTAATRGCAARRRDRETARWCRTTRGRRRKSTVR